MNSEKIYKQKITLAVTGASGSGYFLRLLNVLVEADVQIYLLLSEAAKIVLKTEENETWPDDINELNEFLQKKYQTEERQIIALTAKDWFSPVASGSSAPDKMVICPCSCGTLASIAQGLSNNLIERAADVILKERGQLIIMPRETPFSTIHLRNMLTLSELGVTVMPLAPGFYHQPESIADLQDFMAARVMDHLKIPHKISKRWCE
ncbi:flavin prenyltransferase UbiX [Psychromonas antarctica]|jgi:4-hydroxy-3-polyprenylbenzoate decarboxylase|uniref:flavin prenyltransferase UbiX n=1 Tax=Psychromonas antarctica TaxID=67573 RepID=UPI001EE90F6F|nr:flavin prenyltransferase UbiX [Psychromonas antarctica]MCG6200801.1 UbiX family flavin prenyltransferase [Psychromonas antarctica]